MAVREFLNFLSSLSSLYGSLASSSLSKSASKDLSSIKSNTSQILVTSYSKIMNLFAKVNVTVSIIKCKQCNDILAEKLGEDISSTKVSLHLIYIYLHYWLSINGWSFSLNIYRPLSHNMYNINIHFTNERLHSPFANNALNNYTVNSQKIESP